MHGFTTVMLQKFLDVWNVVWERARRNGADEAKAESTAFGIAFNTAQRAASEETISKSANTKRHYFASFVSEMAERPANGVTLSAREYKFDLMRRNMDLVKLIAVGSAVNFDHETAQQIGVIHDIAMRDGVPPEVLANADKDVQVFFLASMREDVPSEAADEKLLSPEWFTVAGNEALPITFAVTHTPLNGRETGIVRIASEARLDTAEAVEPTPPPVVEIAAKAIPPTVSEGLYASAGCPASGVSPPMPDTPEAPVTDPEVRVASLNRQLETATTALANAELKAAAWKAEFDSLKVTVDGIRLASARKEAEYAAMQLLHAGKTSADKVSYYTDLYQKIGKDEFEQLAASLQVNTLGAYSIKVAAATGGQTLADLKESRERIRAHLSSKEN